VKNPVKIGRLEIVPLRDVWKHEADDFTPWLELEENIELLSETLGMKLIVDATEERLGSFYADMICTDKVDGSRVLIENQIAPTDHRHLGQICTYAAMAKATKIIWVSEKIRDEHREAIEWLNTISNSETSFYAVNVKAFKIGDSEPAPIFEIAAQPQTVSRTTQKRLREITDGELKPSQRKWMTYWSEFLKQADGEIEGVSSRTPYKGNWQTVGSRSGLHGGYIEYNVYASGKNIRAEAYIGGASAQIVFKALELHKTKIESVFGGELTWDENPQRQDCRIASYLEGGSVDFDNGRYVQYTWLVSAMARLIKAIRPVEDSLDFEKAAALLEAEGEL